MTFCPTGLWSVGAAQCRTQVDLSCHGYLWAELLCSVAHWAPGRPCCRLKHKHTRFHIMLLQCVFNNNNHLQIYDNRIKQINSWRQGFQVISNDKNIKQSMIPFSPFLVFPGRISGTLIIINKIWILCFVVLFCSQQLFFNINSP